MIFEIGFPSKSLFFPEFSTRLYVSKLDHTVVLGLKDIILKEESNILANVVSRNEDPIWDNWLTGRLWGYNLLNFNYPEIIQLKDWLGKQYTAYMLEMGMPPEEVYIQCWANLVRNDGRHITPHHHADAHGNISAEHSYLSGNICIQAEDTNTHYCNPFCQSQARSLPNYAGELIMFPSYLVHWADPNKSANPRLSIAFDLITKEVYNSTDNNNYLPLV